VGDSDASAPPVLTAHVINAALALPLVPAARTRSWMEATNQRFANRCLPLLMANQAGWFLISAHSLWVTWNGGNDLGAVKVEYSKGAAPYPASSHFGHGIVTWSVPYLFRTPPGYNLLVRGPSNWPKDGIAPLEGLVETDWSPATFTLNWQLTRPHHPVHFEEGEPIAMLVPQRRSELESFQPQLCRIEDEPQLAVELQRWSTSRAEFNAALAIPSSDAAKKRWQKHYFQGATPTDGPVIESHQTKLELRPFTDRRPVASPAASGDARHEPLRRAILPAAEEILRGLVLVDGFVDRATCEALIQLHNRFGKLLSDSDNGYPLLRAQGDDPDRFGLARSVVGRLRMLIQQRFGVRVACDLALLCALVARGFRHTLHADNAVVVCPRHGSDAEQLRRVGCRCPDAEVKPNHTPWRKYSALLYLSGDHRGGDIVFGDGPNVYGGVYRKQIRVRPGLLVLAPSNELYFHQTTRVEAGVRYSMNSWFTDDAARAAAEWS
jgi:hypothetical protein